MNVVLIGVAVWCGLTVAFNLWIFRTLDGLYKAWNKIVRDDWATRGLCRGCGSADGHDAFCTVGQNSKGG